jgi:hypothetical protein
MNFDISTLMNDLIVYLAGSATLWVFSKTWKNSKDLNEAFSKIRELEKNDKQPE